MTLARYVQPARPANRGGHGGNTPSLGQSGGNGTALDGSVFWHLHRQGRQQGPRVGAGDVPHGAGGAAHPRRRGHSVPQTRGGAVRRRRLGRRPRQADQPDQFPLRRARRPDGLAARRRQPTALRRRGPHRAAGGAGEPRGDRRGRRLHRARPLLRDLGAEGARCAQGGRPQARAREGAYSAPASGRPQMTSPLPHPGESGGHRPVMLREVTSVLDPRDGGIYVDATFGAGGYSRALLDAAGCTVWGIDRDPDAIDAGRALADRYAGRLHLIAGRFGEMTTLLSDRGVDATDGIALDIGVSSMQIDQAERGFSFRYDGPLDMRMQKSGPTAADAVASLDERELADIIHTYGEERRARAIARAIVAARKSAPITRTLQLAEIVHRAIGRRAGDGIDPATRTFQALRIYVNDELGELDRGLVGAER